MVLSTQTSPGGHAPSTAWLFCAACGPLREELAELAGVCLEGVEGLRCVRRWYEVAEPVPFPCLRRWVAENQQVQEALAIVEAERSHDAQKRRPLTHEEIAGAARAALLLGEGKAFLRHYKRYVQVHGGEWHPDTEHVLFWERVLGPGWEGASAVPEGEARADITNICARAFAFFAVPADGAQGRGICGAPANEEYLEVAAALRGANAAALEPLLRAGSPAAGAAAALLRGRPDEAQKAFESLFGRVDETRYRLVQQHGLPLLVYALLGGVYAGASLRFLQAWFSYARYMLQHDFPHPAESAVGEMMLFLDQLERVDELVNRNGCLTLAPDVCKPMSCLPAAMWYRSLPAYVRQELGAEALLGAVELLAQRGLRLLAHYGAAGLRGEASLSPSARQRVEALLDGAQEAPLPPLPPPMTELALAALVACAQKTAGRGSVLEEDARVPLPVLVAHRTESSLLINLEEGAPIEECRPSAALRCMKKFARDGRVVLEGADSWELTRLCVALQSQVEIVGSTAVPGADAEEAEPEAVLMLARLEPGHFVAAWRVRLLPGSTLLLRPGAGLDALVLEDAAGRPVTLRRCVQREWSAVEHGASALQRAGLAMEGDRMRGRLDFHGFPALVSLLRTCRECGVETCWEKGHALRLHQPQAGLSLRVGDGAGEWLELGGGLPVDEGRVLELSALLEAFAAREDGTLKLEDNEYVMLNPVMERQLALLELVMQEKRGRRGVAAGAIPLLDALEPPSATVAAPQGKPAALPAGLQATLRPYQEEGFRWLAERAAMGMGALLADDMGLGKTVQVLALLLDAAGQEGAGASMVVAPISLLGNWAEEAARFAPSLRVVIYDPRKPACLDGVGAGTLVLASYGQIASRQEDFAAQAWQLLVLDEAQAIKNPDSQRARAVCTLRARARFCLTGTPIENSLLDLWSQMRFLVPGLFGNRAAFQRRFKHAGEAERRLLRQVLAPLVLRRTKAEVLAQLPPLTETIEWVEFSREERALYESLRRGAVAKLGGQAAAGTAAGIGILAELTRLRRACCHGKLALAAFAGSSAKLIAMADRVEELRAAGRRVLIFSQFTDVLDLAQATLLERGVSYLRLDGSTPAAQRSRTVRSFQEGRADAFLISLKAGGAGLNLTAADYVMLLDPWWNPAVEAQAAGRSHRMGQQQPVTLCRFMVRGTVEERILEMHRNKKELAEQVLSGSAEGMSLANLRALLGA